MKRFLTGFLSTCSTALCLCFFVSCHSNGTAGNSADGAADTTAVRLQLVTGDVPFPVQMLAAPDTSQRLFITDLGGRIMILKNGTVSPKPFADISALLETKDSTFEVKAMYGLAFHPKFAANKKLYICYNAPSEIDSNDCKMVISEFTVSDTNPDSLNLASEKRIMEFQGHGVDHDACNMAFGPDGFLYISVGDNHTPMAERKGQDLSSLLGKVLRIDVDKTPYGIPNDNPFVGVKNARPEIWAYGLRRFWRFSFDPQTKILIGGEIGDKIQDETDIIDKGGNYGWPLVEGDSVLVKGTDTKNFTAPVDYYDHKVGICVIGGNFYYGKEIPALQGNYVFADYNGSLFKLFKNSNGNWQRQPLKIVNKPADPFLIISCDLDQHNELYVVGVLNTKTGLKGVVYKITNA
ncbi:MAG TPA: PQQ-dependent sugar dehydrogenase [Panacibacter sp.]|nr:PQQ-dependent sugar dehydrogenase [Panacibacter sp.]HNP45038.1 PQQ-dependent sugar dehydrogenase [Panacibacter sp.]